MSEIFVISQYQPADYTKYSVRPQVLAGVDRMAAAQAFEAAVRASGFSAGQTRGNFAFRNFIERTNVGTQKDGLVWAHFRLDVYPQENK